MKEERREELRKDPPLDSFQKQAGWVLNTSCTTASKYINALFTFTAFCICPDLEWSSVHMRELPKFHRNIWNVESLRDIPSGNKGVLAISATGKVRRL
jgi:hypothetical protein